MKIKIQGRDYTPALDMVHPLTIERKLNAPSVCELWLSLPVDGSLPAPTRFQALAVTGDDGTRYFTGYIAVSPLPEYAGEGMEGPRYRTAIQAVSDEILLDQMLMPQGTGISSGTAGQMLGTLVGQSGSSTISAQGVSLAAAVSNYSAQAGSNWSQRAGQIADMARAAYRVTNGALTASNVPCVVHPLNEIDGSLTLSSLTFSSSVKRGLANDITVCGETEPAAYVTEYFLGDGTTAQFDLSANPWFPSTGSSAVIREQFNEPQINSMVWSATGGAGYLALGGGGLAMNGGNGLDGQTVLSWLDPIEMGGTLLMEALGVTLSPGSAGIVSGIFIQPMTVSGCIAGFQATAQPGTGAVSLQPLVLGNATGISFPIDPTRQYALRIRVNCPELERSHSMYYSFGDDGPISAGGQSILAPARIQMEIQQFVNGVAAMPVTLYDGGIPNLPGFCLAVPASSINLIGTIREFNMRRFGSGWVESVPASGGSFTRRTGTAEESAECRVDRSGKVTFYAGSVPTLGEKIAVSYRTMQRAVGRSVNTASQQALAAAGSPATATWIGTVTRPAARSSADCRNAAHVIEQAAASVSALWSGTYKGTRMSFTTDVWPGDALELNAPSTNLDAQVVVRSVKVSYRASLPDVMLYEISFANDWADDLAIRTNNSVPADAWLPAPVAPTVLANLQSVTVAALSNSTVTIDTKKAPPSGGGFEIRLRDNGFMAGSDSTLVMRSAAQNLTFSRRSFTDRFYIRMYDGATPPNYSEFSAALFFNLPL